MGKRSALENVLCYILNIRDGGVFSFFMIYILKFGASWILPPGIFILAILGLAACLWKKRNQQRTAGLFAALSLALYLLSIGAVSDRLMGSLERTYEVPAHPEGDVIVMLGGGAIADVQDVDGVGMLAQSPSSRLLTTLRLHRLYNLPILLSGGQVFSDTGSEAEIARRVLLSLGVPDEMIYVETRSLTTGQNARYSAEILRSEGFTHPILVTSAFHLPRSVLNFEKEGVAVTPYPADFWVSGNPQLYLVKFAPNAIALLTNTVYLQEKLRIFVTRHLE
ncbi:hypothetical protein HMPREF1992_00865 [Selenomonas sp. oral taxon 892 str. F0426]|nr:hypothetical protein HMPREF1992_00865 [Selenomonas sp. oral taxon 892 str. F0426]